MLTPLLAIIKDSFRAALASRVLYVLLVVITVLLLVVAPLHIRESLDWKLNLSRHIRDELQTARLLFDGSRPGGTPARRRIWEQLPRETREAIGEVMALPRPEEPGALDARASGSPVPLRLVLMGALENGLNSVFQGPALWEPGLWPLSQKDDEVQQLVKEGTDRLTANQRCRLNRLLVTAELAPALGPADQSSLETWYGPWQLQFATVSTTRPVFLQGFSAGLNWVFDKFVMSIGLFIAILVTSGMIPEMFEPGSLNLLLSKPVPRWLMLVGKFLGGCAFISLCAGYLFLGLWLWMGLAAGFWDRGLLWSIPLYIIVFAIYFSVSMLVGILYRSAIVSVILTVLFWAACFAVGATWGLFDSRVRNDRLTAAWESGGALFATDCQRRLFRWNAAGRTMEELVGNRFAAPEMELGAGFAMFLDRLPSARAMGPLAVPGGQHVLAATPTSFPLEPQLPFTSQLQAVPVAGGPALDLGTLPNDAANLVAAGERVVLVLGSGRFLVLDPEKLAERVEQVRSSAGEAAAADTLPLFVKAGPDQPLAVSRMARIAADPGSGDLVLMRRNEVARFRWDDAAGRFLRSASGELPSGPPGRDISGMVAVGGPLVVAAWGNGQVALVDGQTMQERRAVQPGGTGAVGGVAVAPDGSRAVVWYRDGRLFQCDQPDQGTFRRVPSRLAGRVEWAGFEPDGRLLVCHDVNRVSRIDLARESRESLAAPRGGFLYNLHHYALNPVYQVFPKPGEFYKLVTHLSAAADPARKNVVDLSDLPTTDNPWSPLWSGLGFMAVVLGVAAWLFSRGDY